MATVDSTFETVVTATLTSVGFRRSRRGMSRREGDLYFSLRLRPKPNQPWGSAIFSLDGGVAVRQCLPFTPRPTKPYDYWQRTVPWQTVNYGFEPDAPSPGRAILTSDAELADALGRERDAFLMEIVGGFPTVEYVREHLWRVFSTESSHEFGTAQTAYQTRFLAVLLASAGDVSRLAQVQAQRPDLWSPGLPTSNGQDWDSLLHEARLRR